jgi:hypothetical protein
MASRHVLGSPHRATTQLGPARANALSVYSRRSLSDRRRVRGAARPSRSTRRGRAAAPSGSTRRGRAAPAFPPACHASRLLAAHPNDGMSHAPSPPAAHTAHAVSVPLVSHAVFGPFFAAHRRTALKLHFGDRAVSVAARPRRGRPIAARQRTARRAALLLRNARTTYILTPAHLPHPRTSRTRAPPAPAHPVPSSRTSRTRAPPAPAHLPHPRTPSRLHAPPAPAHLPHPRTSRTRAPRPVFTHLPHPAHPVRSSRTARKPRTPRTARLRAPPADHAPRAALTHRRPAHPTTSSRQERLA